MLMIDDFTVK